MMNTIIDTHTHLYDLPDMSAVLADSAAQGVSDVVVLGVDLASNRKHLELSQGMRDAGRAGNRVISSAPLASSKIHLALGLHPGNIVSQEDTDACLVFMRAHAREAVAIGESGLDYHYKGVKDNDAKKREQQDVFLRQLSLAKEFDLPIVVHSRAAYRDCLEMTRASGVGKANFHWYTGPMDILKEILDAGFFVSVSPSLEYSPEARAVAGYAPIDRLLVETDTPVRGWTPRDVWRTLRLLSEARGEPQDKVLAAVNQNARDFFGF